ncbi:MAG: mechanosensitive ion channel family protein [Flavobacteriales bacterium]
MRVVAQKPGASVTFNEIDLFEVYAENEELDRQDRAAVIASRLKNYAENGRLQPDSFRVSQRDSSYYIEYGNKRVFKIRPGDAEAMEASQAEAAQLYLDEIQQKLAGRNAVNYVKNMVINVVLALMVILLLFLVIRYMNKLFRYLNVRLIRSNSDYLKGVSFRNYEFLGKERLITLLSSGLGIIKWVFILVLIYISLPILFSIFPGTEGIARSLFALVLNPVRKILTGLVNYLPNLVTIGVIALAVRYAVRFIRFLSDEIKSEKLVIPGFYPDWAYPTYQILRFVFIAFGFIMIFPYLPGSDSPIFQGVSVFLGLLVSFGSGSAISNAVAGIVITYMRPYKLGDRVKIGEVTGDVIEKSMLVTRVRTIKNEDITIPNSTILSNHTVNYSTIAKEKGVILYTTVTIGYDVPWKDVHKALIKAGKGTAMIEESPEPFVLQTSLDDFYVSYQLNCYTKYPEKAALIYSNIHANIQDEFNSAGIEILSPHYRAARDGNMTTIPVNYLPSDYKAPSFGIKVDKEG